MGEERGRGRAGEEIGKGGCVGMSSFSRVGRDRVVLLGVTIFGDFTTYEKFGINCMRKVAVASISGIGLLGTEKCEGWPFTFDT